jgi:hypothetical protein
MGSLEEFAQQRIDIRDSEATCRERSIQKH